MTFFPWISVVLFQNHHESVILHGVGVATI